MAEHRKIIKFLSFDRVIINGSIFLNNYLKYHSNFQSDQLTFQYFYARDFDEIRPFLPVIPYNLYGSA